jgi:hypothetical protein
LASLLLRRFSNVSVLRSIALDRLVAFLEPFRGFFTQRRYHLPPVGLDPDLDYPRLVEIFMSPDASTPKGLLDALFLVDEMATPEGMDALLEAAKVAGLPLDPGLDHSPADIAVQVWLLDSDILERRHAQQFLLRPRSYETFQSNGDEPPVYATPAPAVRHKLERELDDWFEEKKRGRNCRVFTYERKDQVAFLVRHGQPFKREESQVGTDVASVCYRPIKYDVLVYDRQLGELQINAQLISEKKMYCRQIGKHLFGDEDCFPGTNKYTLEPLREYGADALACGDVDGIELITLVEVEFFWGGGYRSRDVKKADDIFADLEARQRELPSGGRITKATFKIKFSDSKAPRSVTIRRSNVASYTRDSDAELVEQWLRLRGFTVEQEPQDHASLGPTLVGA